MLKGVGIVVIRDYVVVYGVTDCKKDIREEPSNDRKVHARKLI